MHVETFSNGDKIFVASDGWKFSYQKQAEDHERYLVAKKHVEGLRHHLEEWFLVRSNNDVRALFLIASGGEFDGPDLPEHNYPCWARTGQVYQDRDNYWQDSFQMLYFDDLRDMLFGAKPNLEEV